MTVGWVVFVTVTVDRTPVHPSQNTVGSAVAMSGQTLKDIY